MKNNISFFTFCFSLVYVASVLSVSFSFSTDGRAANPNFADRAVTRINFEGRKKCRELRDSGYTASASGIIESGSGVGSNRFQIRTCFPTLAECNQFIDQLGNHVGQIDILYRKGCSPRN